MSDDCCKKCGEELPEWGWNPPERWTCPDCGTTYEVDVDSEYTEELGSWCWYTLKVVE